MGGKIFGAILCLGIMLLWAAPALAQTNQPYTIRKPDAEPKRVLFVVDYNATRANSASDAKRRISVFRQILGSYWPIEAETRQLSEINPAMLEAFDVIVVSDELGNELAPARAAQFANLNGKQVVWFGLNGDRILRDIGGIATKPLAKVTLINSVQYKSTELISSEGTHLEMSYEIVPPAENEGAETLITSEETESPLALRFSGGNGINKNDYHIFPFTLPSYYFTSSYTNAVLDIMHGPLGDPGEMPKQALVRLEDVNGYTYRAPSNRFFDAGNWLISQDVPFHVALIERYIDPGRGIDTSTKDHRHFNYYLKKLAGTQSAVLVQHGYTHQYKESVSALGYEFWDADNNAPVPGDMREFVGRKVTAARQSMEDNGIPSPDIWETPHYTLSSEANDEIDKYYPLRYERVFDIGSLPFAATIDGVIYLPENLGYIRSDWSTELADFKQRYAALKTFRNPTPSFFWHPWRDTQEIKTLVDMIRADGYEFVTAYDLLETNPSVASNPFTVFASGYNSSVNYVLINYLIIGVYTFFIIGVIAYVRGIFLFNKYFNRSQHFRLSLSELYIIARKKHRQLPYFVIFVPARNEGFVIANTIQRLLSAHYPKDRMQIVVITDERELSDDVEITTKAEVQRMMKKHNSEELPVLSHIMVPEWYSGKYNSSKRTYAKSTKGRALNYALQVYRQPKLWRNRSVYIGVLDADGRMHPDTLSEAALSILVRKSQILQGPVLQVSNFSKVSLIGKMAGLELARYHLTHMEHRLHKAKKLQFLAGTNYFIKKKLIKNVGGWNEHALVEDAELALRAYEKKRVIADPLCLLEVEQTPERFAVYRKQRERWARGHFQLLPTISRSKLPLFTKFVLYQKIISSQFRFLLDLAIPIIAIVLLFRGLFLEVELWMQLAAMILLVANFFIWDMYGFTFRSIVHYTDMKPTPWNIFKTSLRLFIAQPMLIVVQAIPRFEALKNVIFRTNVSWYKTERTKEVNQTT